MLSMNSYTQDYVDECRKKLIYSFQPTKIWLQRRTIELKDGNPLNEVRLLCDSIMLYDNKLTKETKSKLN